MLQSRRGVIVFSRKHMLERIDLNPDKIIQEIKVDHSRGNCQITIRPVHIDEEHPTKDWEVRTFTLEDLHGAFDLLEDTVIVDVIASYGKSSLGEESDGHLNLAFFVLSPNLPAEDKGWMPRRIGYKLLRKVLK